MELERLNNIIEEIYQDALEDKKYRFGFDTNRGTSNKVATGSLLNSIKAIPKQNEIGVQANKYGRYVDSGRKPGAFPPIKDILVWIKAKGIRTQDKTKEQLAYAIGKNIEKFGIPASNWLTVAEQNIITNKKFEELLTEIAIDELINNLEKIE